MILNFRYRVERPFTGDATLAVLRPIRPFPLNNPKVYWDANNWQDVREDLIQNHHCMHQDSLEKCRIQRLQDVRKHRVLDCRCCGGVIVEQQKGWEKFLTPTDTEVGKRTQIQRRTRKAAQTDIAEGKNVRYFELNDAGRAKRQRRT